MMWQVAAHDLADDARVAGRRLWRSPAFLGIATVVLALGFTATGVVFSTVNGWLSVGASIPNSHRLVAIGRLNDGSPTDGYFEERSYRLLFELKLRSVDSLCATQPVRALLSVGTTAAVVRAEAVTGAYFRAIGVSALLGRTLLPEDDRVGTPAAVVLSEGAWRQYFAADPHVVGRQVRLSGVPVTIVGVMPAVVRGLLMPTSTSVEIWVPTEVMRPILSPSGAAVWGQVFGRLTDGATLAAASAEIAVTGRRFDPAEPGLGATVLPVEQGAMPGRVRLAIVAVTSGLVALSLVVVFIVCANLANLMLARSVTRSAEWAVRLVLGAPPARVFRLQVLEASAVSVLGGVGGYVLVRLVAGALATFAIPTEGGTLVGRPLVDHGVLAYFFGLVAVTSIAISVLPALRVIRMEPARVLSSSGLRAGASARVDRRRGWLVAAQVAASVMLLAVAGLFVRSAFLTARYSVGFGTDGVAVGHLDLAVLRWSATRGLAAQEALLAAARDTSGVRSALAAALPASGGGDLVAIDAGQGLAPPSTIGPPCRCVAVSPGYLELLRVPRVRGRLIDERDSASAPGVVVVNTLAAQRLWHGGDPVGQALRIRRGPPLTVIGVVEETDRTARDFGDRCYVFVPLAQRYTPRFIVAAAGPQPLAVLSGPLSRNLARVMPDVPVFNAMTAEASLRASSGPLRTAAAAWLVLGAIGLATAVVGLYAVMSFVVTMRRGELALRSALGARRGRLFLLIIGDAWRLLGMGMAAGVPLALIVASQLREFLVGVTPYDPLTYAFVAVFMLGVGTAAAAIPARQAVGSEPASLLNSAG